MNDDRQRTTLRGLLFVCEVPQMPLKEPARWCNKDNKIGQLKDGSTAAEGGNPDWAAEGGPVGSKVAE